jgi:hypothetical protein
MDYWLSTIELDTLSVRAAAACQAVFRVIT